MLRRSGYLFLILLGFIACKDKEGIAPPHGLDLLEIPRGFPALEFPVDNAFTETRWQLGKQLFYDPILSVDSSISCGHCHQQELAFSDGLAVSLGVEQRPGNRNAPTLFNVAYHPYFTREGGVPTLEMQILVPIQEHAEFDFNIVLVAERLAKDPAYVALADAAYGREPDPFVITRSLATFERSLLSGYSPYDQFQEYGHTEALTEGEKRGMDLFFSERTQCAGCHGGFDFTNYSFANNGLYETYEDPGRFRLTSDSSDLATFKVPSLRNVGHTAPYMHDGSIETLEAVIDHYHSGGKDHPNKSDLLRPLDLSEAEKSDLVSFLRALSDEAALTNPFFSH